MYVGEGRKICQEGDLYMYVCRELRIWYILSSICIWGGRYVGELYGEVCMYVYTHVGHSMYCMCKRATET